MIEIGPNAKEVLEAIVGLFAFACFCWLMRKTL